MRFRLRQSADLIASIFREGKQRFDAARAPQEELPDAEEEEEYDDGLEVGGWLSSLLPPLSFPCIPMHCIIPGQGLSYFPPCL